MTTSGARQDAYYAGIRMVRYDLLKELAVATTVMLVVVLALAALLSSADVPPLTVQKWAQDDPIDFVTTATSELAGTSTSAQYGAPYNAGDASVQRLGPLAPQDWAGVRLPVDPARDFVLAPLKYASVGNPELATALGTYAASDTQLRGAWLDRYGTALRHATQQDGRVVVAAGDYGPLPILMTDLLNVARTGGLDGQLLDAGRFYQTDYTRPLLFMGDGGHFQTLAQEQRLVADQWGMMNETGQYPGQTWLWLYTAWYQLPPFQSGGWFAANADLVVVIIMAVLTALLALVPFVPGLRDIPRYLPLHRLIWRRSYRGVIR
ncbi:MAG: hypothetical protein ACYC9W_08930 [Candidatus Limnocylindria bacterium]